MKLSKEMIVPPLITGICGIVAGALGFNVISNNSVNSCTISMDGKIKILTKDEYQDLIEENDELKNRIIIKENEINDLNLKIDELLMGDESEIDREVKAVDVLTENLEKVDIKFVSDYGKSGVSITEGEMDNAEVVYDQAFNTYSPGYIEYLVEDYEYFVGTACLDFNDRSTEKPSIIKIFVDGVLIKEFDSIKQGFDAQEFCILLENAKKLKIQFTVKGNSAFIGNPSFYKLRTDD